MFYQRPLWEADQIFFPPQFTITSEDLSTLEQEIIELHRSLPETQQLIALEYIRQQGLVWEAARGRKLTEDFIKSKIAKK